MNKTLRISFSLKNTYHVNSILYMIKQIPFIKKLLPENIYGVQGLKIFANIISVLWEIISAFLGKALYFFIMIVGVSQLYSNLSPENLHVHILFFLTVIGAFFNTSIFNPTRDKYYAIILMRMDAKEHTLINYGYDMLKVFVGFYLISIFMCINGSIPVWFSALLPLCIVCAKLAASTWILFKYEKNGYVHNENKTNKYFWLMMFLGLAFAYGLPLAGIVVPSSILMAVMILFIPLGAAGIMKIINFRYYREINKQLLSKITSQTEEIKTTGKKASEKLIVSDSGITSKRKGFEYLNELFVKRHRKILWRSSKRITFVCLFLIFSVVIAFILKPEFKDVVNGAILNWMPYFAFVMYAINRGTSFTNALFMNCDHSLLTYSFFKQPKFILKLFKIRLREIIKINLMPAITIGAGLDAIMYLSGGTDNVFNYIVIFISIVCLSIFFSVHYLMIYYLLQPYNVGTEMKSGLYMCVLWVTYMVCYFMMKIRMQTMVFGILCISFCILYCVVACALVYRLAPKTFKLRT